MGCTDLSQLMQQTMRRHRLSPEALAELATALVLPLPDVLAAAEMHRQLAGV